MNKKRHQKIFLIAITGILGALALALSFIEKLLLSAFPLPMGIKPGFSNIIVMFTCSALGLLPALGIAVIKAGFASLLSGASAGFISLFGGILSVLTMYFSMKLSKEKLSYTGISVLSSVMHNIGQLSAASIIAGSSLFLGYMPILLISGAVFGVITGVTLNLTLPHLKKLKIFDHKNLYKTQENGGKNYG
ncbi:MAG: Gx transporter family protein [Clostridia bacterium]|nr:Gx transporter family protein [Clostridia bacterium]